jgi:flagellar hook-associated protein 1 FlgK
LLVEKLGNLVNVTTVEQDADEFMVHIDGQILVQGSARRELATVVTPENSGFSRVVWADTGNEARFDVVSHSGIHAGSLGALVELRDGDLRRESQSLDTMAVNFADLVNDIHRNAVGANGTTGLDFFVTEPFTAAADGAYDANGDGDFDSTYLFRLTGTNVLRPQDQLGFAGTITIAGKTANIAVNYTPTDTVQQVIDRVNKSDGEVKAYVDRDGRLALKATTASDMQNPDFVIRHVEDSGYFLTNYAGLLAAAGPEGAYDYAVPDAAAVLAPAPAGAPEGATYRVTPALGPAAYMRVSAAIQTDPLSVASAYRDPRGDINVGDGRAAADIAAIRNTPIMVGRNRTLDDYFAETATNVGLLGEQAANMAKTQTSIMQALRDERSSFSGVNIDEELADMIRFQHGYNAAAKFVSVIDEMLDTIINGLV